MLFPFCSLFNPLLDSVDLRRSEWLWGFLRGHAFLGVVVTYPEKQFTRFRFPRNHQDMFPFTEQTVLEVQSQLGFALFFIGPVASEAMVGQNGADVSVEVDCTQGYAHKECEGEDKKSEVHL